MTTHSVDGTLPPKRDETLTTPPGFAGQLCDYIYESSYMPVKEVAVAATLAILAGVCGRAYRTHTGKDLALYQILVARSGIGKDGIHDGIPRLLKNAPRGAERLLRTENFVSGPALHKALLREPGFLNLQGEFGRKLKRMADPRDTPMQALRTVMTDAYAKEYLPGLAYSKEEDCFDGVSWPALSFLGETTPNTYLESLTTDMMEDGFLSRFVVITHEGIRPFPNHQRREALTADEQDRWNEIVSIGIQYQMPINTSIPRVVRFKDEGAWERMNRFEYACTDEINSTVDESERQLHNRAHLKALKIAGLLAVADNPSDPQIDLGHAVWAIILVRRGMDTFRAHKLRGDIGNSDHSRQSKLLALMRDYIFNGASPGYKLPKAMSNDGIIPRKYLQQKTSSSPPFLNYKAGGASLALDHTLKSLIDSGYIVEADKLKMAQIYAFHGKCYVIINLPDSKTGL